MEKLLKADEVAALASLEIQAIYRYAREKKIPSIRIGSKIRFPESALKQWIEGQLGGNLPPQPAEAGATSA